MSETARIGMTLIEPGQLQKEVAHNSALERIDLAVQTVATSVFGSTPPGSPSVGEIHVVGADATGAWEGHDDALAMMGAGGWIFLEGFEGLTAYEAGAGLSWRFEDGAWRATVHRGGVQDSSGNDLLAARQPAVALPAGGATQDDEARAAIAAIVDRLAAHGLIETA